jgi:hypothetical protein
MYFFSGHLVGRILRHSEAQSTEESSFWQFKKVGSELSQNIRNADFGKSER